MSDENCKAIVLRRGYWAGRCNRKAAKDGYCAQHHPDTVVNRKAERDAKWIADVNKRMANQAVMEMMKAERDRRYEAYPELVAWVKKYCNDHWDQKAHDYLKSLGEWK
jgi:hypothetical protein